MCIVWIYQETKWINICYYERILYGMMTIKRTRKSTYYRQKLELQRKKYKNFLSGISCDNYLLNDIIRECRMKWNEIRDLQKYMTSFVVLIIMTQVRLCTDVCEILFPRTSATFWSFVRSCGKVPIFDLVVILLIELV